MRWVIKNPAPLGPKLVKWGDYHFGRSIAKYLERRGDEVISHYQPVWDVDIDADAVLVLRGKFPFPPATSNGGALRVLWNISHPGDVPSEEYASYDLVFVASRSAAATVRQQIDKPVFAMLQCSDLEEFTVPETPRQDVVFVGNTREVERPAVLWAVEYGLPLKVWGRGWTKFGLSGKQIVGDYHPNEDLGALYGRSLATLNDHWDDMKEYGFINNRVLDALASATPVISDWHQELHDELPPGSVLFYRDRAEFEACMESLLLDYPTVLEGARRGQRAVKAGFSFETRVDQIRQLVLDGAGRR